MKRIICDADASGGLRHAEVEAPEPAANECVLRVTAFSLNRGEVNMAAGRETGAPIGWDVAGVIETAAADGSGLPAGTRAVGFCARMDGWAEQVAVPTDCVAEIPEGVDDATAATLPVAGLTALYCLERGTRLLGANALVTGANGGVGLFAVQLASSMGANVIAQVRKSESAGLVRNHGADEVVVTDDGSGLERFSKYRLILDGVGGDQFGKLVPLLTKGGTLVSYGVTGGAESSLQIYPDLFGGGGQKSIYGMTLYTEREFAPIHEGLDRLLRLVVNGRLKSHVDRIADWQATPAIAQDLLDRRFSGKAVLTIS